jgi:hypothetical protein
MFLILMHPGLCIEFVVATKSAHGLAMKVPAGIPVHPKVG